MPTSANLVLLLIDELQCLYNNPSRYSALFGYMKRLKQGEGGLRLRIVAAAIFGNSPSQHLASSSLSSNQTTMTPFEYSPEQLVGFHPVDDDTEPFLALGTAEHNEMWLRFWDACPQASDAFLDCTTRDAIFSISAGQASCLHGITTNNNLFTITC